MSTSAGAVSAPIGRAFPWLSAGLLVSAGTAQLVASSPEARGITLDVAVLLVVGLVVFVIAVDAGLARVGAPVAVLLLVAWSVAVGAVAASIAIATGLGHVPAGFLIAAAVIGVAGTVAVLRRRSRRAPTAAEPAAIPPVQNGPAAALALYLEPVNAVLRLVRGVNRFVGESREDPGWNARHGIPAERRSRPR